MNTIGGSMDGFSFLKAQNTLKRNQSALANSLERVSTGFRINRGSDDPAGLITSENLRAVLASLDAETRMLERADAVAATADGALAEVSDLLNQAEGLVVANANSAGMSQDEIAANQMEIDSILAAVNRIAETTSFNGDKLLDGTATLSAGGETVNIESIAIGPIGEGEAAQAALADARSMVSSLRGEIGAFSKYTVQSGLTRVGVAMENVAAAESTIRNTNYAEEIANLSRLTLLDNGGMMALMLVNEAQGQTLNFLG